MQRKPPPSPAALRDAQRRAAQRQAIRALERAEREAAKAGVTLSDWEGEFLGSVSDRVKTYGRAFGDPEKGAAGQALSNLQTRKLKEIAAKSKGESPAARTFRQPLRRSRP